MLKLRQLRHRLRIKLRLKAAPSFKSYASYACFYLASHMRIHTHIHAYTCAPMWISYRSYRSLSSLQGLRRSFIKNTRSFSSGSRSFYKIGKNHDSCNTN